MRDDAEPQPEDGGGEFDDEGSMRKNVMDLSSFVFNLCIA
jgi:hypothetical protein